MFRNTAILQAYKTFSNTKPVLFSKQHTMGKFPVSLCYLRDLRKIQNDFSRAFSSIPIARFTSLLDPHSQLFQNVFYAYGDPGIQWLKSLPERVNRLAMKWELNDLSIVAPTEYSYNCVLLGNRKNAQPIVLKLSFDKETLLFEARALKVYAGNGSVKLLGQDEAEGAILRECILPGASLSDKYHLDDKQIMPIITKVLFSLHKGSGLSTELKTLFPTLEKKFLLFNSPKAEQQIPKEHLNRAKLLSQELLTTQKSLVLLHGDLHPQNVLLDRQGQWISIDPKGVIGEPVLDSIPYVKHAINEVPSSTIEERILYFSNAFGVDPKRLRDWCYVETMASLCQAITYGPPSTHWQNCQSEISCFYVPSPSLGKRRM